MRRIRIFMSYLMTITAVGLTGYLRILLIEFIGDTNPYIFFIPAIIVATSYGGLYQGLLSICLSLLAVNYFIITPDNLFNFRDLTNMTGLLSFIFTGILVSWFINALNKSKDEIKKFYSAFEQAGDGIFITDKNGYIQFVNEEFERISGYKANEAIGKTPRIVKSGKQKDEFYLKLWKTITSGKSFRGEFNNRKKTGELFYTDHTITPIKDSRGKIINYVGIWKDITKLKEIEQRKDEFISIASHELKTPLTSIKGYAQILREKLKKTKNKALISYIKRMDLQISNMTNLVYELLDVNRIEAGKMILNKSLFDINTLIRETIADIQITTRIKIIFNKTSKPIKIYADKVRLSQVIKNLISNAIKFSDKKKKIKIDCRRINSKVLFSVQDFGIGIKRGEQKKIFERFYQIRGSERGNPSFGIGLFIASMIVIQHEGRIWVKSKKGQGSTFYFTLPLKRKRENK